MKTINKLSIVCFSVIILVINGCKKELSSKPGNVLNTKITSVSEDSLVLTPEGWIPASHVHLIENGAHLEIRNGRVLKISTTSGKLLEDLGAKAAAGTLPATPNTRQLSTNSLSTLGVNTNLPGSWMTCAEWDNNPSGVPINYFSTNWVVPNAPATTEGQTIFIFNGLEPTYSSDILQPVLQWGSGADGGGNYWAVANWYGFVDTQGQYVFGFNAPIQVSPGTNLQGVITYTGQQSDGSYNYTSSFPYYNTLYVYEGNIYGSDTIPPAVAQLTRAFETLEAYNNTNYDNGYGVYQISDYPSGQYDVAMTNIKLSLNNSPASLNWSPSTGPDAVHGEITNVISNNASGSGQVNLYFYAYTFEVVNTNNTSTNFTVSVNGNRIPGTYQTAAKNQQLPISITTVTNSNSTVALTFNSTIPASAFMVTSYGRINGTINGNIITFSGVHLTNQLSYTIQLN